MVHVLPHDSEITVINKVRSGWLAISVRKKFVLANPLTYSYYIFEWFKPLEIIIGATTINYCNLKYLRFFISLFFRFSIFSKSSFDTV